LGTQNIANKAKVTEHIGAISFVSKMEIVKKIFNSTAIHFWFKWRQVPRSWSHYHNGKTKNQ